jgi:hypothetical protein
MLDQQYQVRPGRVMVSRRGPAKLVVVDKLRDQVVIYYKVDEWGRRAKRARTCTTERGKFLRAFSTYRPCRWNLVCLDQAAVAVYHRELGRVIEACTRCSSEHTIWANTHTGTDRIYSTEPAPDCWCPDIGGSRERVPYCPQHGSANQAGTNMLPDALGLTEDPAADHEGLNLQPQQSKG